MFARALDKALANISSALRSVKGGQEVSPSAFELRHELFRQLQFDLGVAPKFPKRAKYSRQAEGRPVFHNCSVRCITELFRLGVSIFNVAEPIDQLAVQGVFSGKDTTVGNGVSQHVRGQIALLRNDPEKLVVGLHHKALDQITFLRGHWTRAIQNVLELATLKNH